MVRIPEEYQEVEYIESTGTQYILTNYTPTVTEDMKIELDYVFTTNQAGESMVFGSTARSTGIRFQCEYYNSTRWYIGSGINQFRQVLNRVGDKNNTRYSMLIDGGTLTVDNQSIDYTEKWSGLQALPMCIFAINWINEIRYLNKGIKIYKLIFTANGIKEAEFVPCYRKSDNEIGMYDTVSKTFYTNSGTGTFLKGHNVYYDDVNLLEQRRKILLNTPHLETVQNNIVTFNTDMNVSLKDCKIYFSPIQEGEGDPSPDNVRPISGWDGVAIYHTGKNIIDINDMKSTYPWSSGTYKVYNLFIGKNKTVTISHKNIISLGKSFYFIVGRNQSEKNGNATGAWIYHNTISAHSSTSLTITTDQYGYIYLKLYTSNNQGLQNFYNFILNDNFQIEYGTEKTSYEEYINPIITNISFPQTIYGGYVDLIKGEIVKTYQKYSFTGDQPLTKQDSYVLKPFVYGFNGNTLKNIAFTSSYDINLSVCNKLKIETARFHYVHDGCISITNSSVYVYLLFNGSNIFGETAEEAKTKLKEWYDNNEPLEIASKLKQSFETIYSINSQTLKTLKGTNNIFSNANGNVEIKFWSHLNNAYQHIPAETLTTTDDFIIATNDNYIIGNENNYIIY